MRERPELNGKDAEIISRGADEHGFLTVRIFDDRCSNAGESKGVASRKMKVHPSRLEPAQSRVKHGPLLARVTPLGTTMREDRSCVSIASNSVVSRNSTMTQKRPLSSSLSASALSALYGYGGKSSALSVSHAGTSGSIARRSSDVARSEVTLRR
eukprot:CAMPEP_0169318732 /NCGR_PEP_ID=MMETSP1017-20121227/7443_1 /TAXON_ID=342587 /ORGANISM="Karlodinium micrum, Strain CCMP2283" /LENGTH=154 /DNA_ID=CAMNT_0009413027 /DNA_START=165 /DNA_END=629 /DNA_ORIENTATION=+